MSDIFVVVEHRLGEIRDITFEMLWKAGELAEKLSHSVTAVLLGDEVDSLAQNLSDRADTIIIYDDERLKSFNADLSKQIIAGLIEELKPPLTLMGSTSWGMELAPCLSVKSGLPLATDCIDVIPKNGTFMAQRQMYNGKIFSNVSFADAPGCLVTVRSGVFPKDKLGDRKGVQRIRGNRCRRCGHNPGRASGFRWKGYRRGGEHSAHQGIRRGPLRRRFVFQANCGQELAA
jgi:electron transfer flavoprotein alpha subunit